MKSSGHSWQPVKPGRKLGIFTLWIVMLFAAPMLPAQTLVDCEGLGDTSTWKVVFDKFEYRNAAGQTTVLTETLAMEIMLEMLSRFNNLFPETRMKPLLCAKRDPKPDASDFDKDLVNSLNGNNVLVEIWGNVKGAQQDGEEVFGANIAILLIPVRHYEGADKKLDFHLIKFPKEQRGDLESASLGMLLSPEFDVYTSIAHSIKALKNEKYDNAKKFLGNAQLQWQSAIDAGLLAQSATDQQGIVDYMASLDKKIVAEAKQDPDYKGDLIAVEHLLAERNP